MNLNWHKIKTVIGLVLGYALADVMLAYPQGIHLIGIDFQWGTVWAILIGLGIVDAARDPIPNKYLPGPMKTEEPK